MIIRSLDSYASGQSVTGCDSPVLYRTWGLLVTDRALVDAGRVGSKVSLEEQRRSRVVSLTHLRFNDIRDLPPPADNLFGVCNEPVVSAAIPKSLDGSMPTISNPRFHERIRQELRQ